MNTTTSTVVAVADFVTDDDDDETIENTKTYLWNGMTLAGSSGVIQGQNQGQKVSKVVKLTDKVEVYGRTDRY